MGYGSVIDNIRNKFDSLFPAEKKVASYILDNINAVVNMNVSDLAQAAETSDATVVRAVKHLGYEGYYDLRISLSRDIGKSEIMDDSDETLTSIQKFLSFEAERVTRLTSTLNFNELIDIANVILNSRMAHIVAVGNTTPISVDLGFRLERIGIACDYSSLYEEYINHITLGSPDDCVIAITRSGRSNQVVRAVELGKKKGMSIIGITGDNKNTITSYFDYAIFVNEMKNTVSEIYHPDSHLQEMVINDVLVYIIKSVQKVNEIPKLSSDDTDTVGILLSEFKQS